MHSSREGLKNDMDDWVARFHLEYANYQINKMRREAMNLQQGIIRKLEQNKGYGFITAEDKKDYFFHMSDFQGHWKDLEEDTSTGMEVPVEFKPDSTPKGPRARNVNRLDYPNQS